MFDGNVRTFKYYNEEKRINHIRFIPSDKVIKYNDELFAIEIWLIVMKNMIIAENKNLQLIDSKFLNKIKKLSDTTYSIYMIVEKKDLTRTCWLTEMTYYKKFLRYLSKIKIKINIKGRLKDAEINKILRLQNNISYTFALCGRLDECLDFLHNYRFVNKVKELNGKITCRGIDIDVRQLCLKGKKYGLIGNLKRKIEDNDLE